MILLHSLISELKKNIKPIKNALDKVCELNGVTFENILSGEHSTGLIAQDVLAVLPEATSKTEHGDIKDLLSVKYGNLVGLLVESIKELRYELNKLKGV